MEKWKQKKELADLLFSFIKIIFDVTILTDNPSEQLFYFTNKIKMRLKSCTIYFYILLLSWKRWYTVCLLITLIGFDTYSAVDF